jgi:putative DNA primase/helicase
MVRSDTDEPGRKYVEAVAKLASKAGAREVKLLHVPGEHPPGWDAADALAEGWQAFKGFEHLDIGYFPT